MADEVVSERDDPFIGAGQYSLRVLEGEDLVKAHRLMLSDPDFAQAVAWWDRNLGTMAEEAEVFAPSADVKHAIMDRIRHERQSASDIAQMVPTPNKASPLSVGYALFGTAMAAAAFILFISTPNPASQSVPAPAVQQGPQFVVQMQSEDGKSRLAGIIEPGSRRIAMRASGLQAAAGETAELWVIPEGGAPRSLGYIPNSGVLDRNLTATEASLLVEGSALAVTFEKDTGVPHEAPTLPIVLTGPVDRV